MRRFVVEHGKTLAGVGAALTAGGAAVWEAKRYSTSNWTTERVDQENKKGNLIFSRGGNTYNGAAFAPRHPGGEYIIRSIAGRSIDGVFEQKPFQHHLESPTVKEELEKMRLGRLKGQLPQFDTTPFLPSSEDQENEAMYVHNALNKERRTFSPAAHGEMGAEFFVRNHGVYPTRRKTPPFMAVM